MTVNAARFIARADVSIMATIVFLSVVALVLSAMFVRLVLRYRGKRVVTCPETKAPVGATISAALAAGTWIVDRPRFVITTCSRWPGRAGCDQACAPQIEASPDATLVRNIVAKWYAERTCAYCAAPIHDVGFAAVSPALLGRDGTLREWNDVSPEELPRVLSSAVAVCARCELAEDFRRRFPRRVIERPRAIVTRRWGVGGASAAVY